MTRTSETAAVYQFRKKRGLVRKPADCRYILASVITTPELTEASLAMLLGLLGGVYVNHPEALFWDVLVKFLEKRHTGGAIIIP
jgi:hypothetical protein